jgi:hypothetical protein
MKATLSVCHTTRVYQINDRMVPCILNLSARRKCAVHFTLQYLTPNSRCTRGRVWSKASMDMMVKRKVLFLPWIKSLSSNQNVVTLLTELSCLILGKWNLPVSRRQGAEVMTIPIVNTRVKNNVSCPLWHELQISMTLFPHDHSHHVWKWKL